MFEIRPSILDLSKDQIKDSIEILESDSRISAIHFDVMDGKFVPKKSFSPKFLRFVKSLTSLKMEVHLMVKDNFKLAKKYIKNGADYILFHLEAMENEQKVSNLIKFIRSKNVKVGLVIKPKTSPKAIEKYLPLLDLVLVMSVEPGLGGQKFIDGSLDKIAKFDSLRKEYGYRYKIEVDGGVKANNFISAVTNGADYLVMGSGLFKGDLVENLGSIKYE